MILRPAIVCLLLLCTAFSQRAGPAMRPPLRVALVGFGSGGPSAIATVLTSALEESGRVLIVEPALLHPALTALGYEGSLNMSTDEARRLGSAIGCDFFVIGKAEVVTRSERAKESHQEGLLAVMIVDGRSGTLAVFDLLIEKAQSSEKAVTAVSKALAARASGYVDQMIQFRASRESISPSPAIQRAEFERLEDMPLEGSRQAVGFKPPEFLSRVKPEYTAEAERADVNATVEVMVVLRSSGEVGEAEITRWAGFGLEDSALRAIRQLKFNPATRNGQPVSVRAMIRYNFRRIGQ
jgi:TonB family protein